LLLLVLAKELDQRVGEADRSASGSGLGGLVFAAGLLFPGAVAGLPTARGVCAAVGVLGAEAVLADGDVPSVQVDVFPVETERFPLAEPEGRGDDPPRAVAEFGGLDEEALNLLDRERLDVLFFETRSLGDLGHVGGDVTASLGLTQGDSDRPVSVVGGAGGAPGLLHLPVEALKVLGLQLVELVGTQAGTR
jgi:hypothetical protein